MTPYKSQILTGDWVGQQWVGPSWTPYAQAIASPDYYPNQMPWYSSHPVDLPAATTTAPVTRTVLTKPNQYDVLIFGAMIQGTAGQIPFIGVQVTDQESGVPWAVDNVLPFIPLSAFGGLNTNATSLFRWPEAFFLPRRTRLKLDFNLIDVPVGNPDPFILTLVGVQLINHRGQPPIKTITMPDDSVIRTDSRLPMFLTMGVGRRTGNNFFLSDSTSTRNQVVQYLPPINRDFEVHDASLSNLSAVQAISDTANLQIKLTVMGLGSGWTPTYAPAPAVFGGPGGGVGDVTKVFPALPFCKPYLLPKDHRLQLQMINVGTSTSFSNAYITFRGVRLCEY